MSNQTCYEVKCGSIWRFERRRPVRAEVSPVDLARKRIKLDPRHGFSHKSSVNSTPPRPSPPRDDGADTIGVILTGVVNDDMTSPAAGKFHG